MRTAPPLLLKTNSEKMLTSLRNPKLTTPQIRAQINVTQSSCSRHILTSTVQGRRCELGLYGLIAAGKPLLRKNNKQKRFGWAKKHKEIRPVEICALHGYTVTWPRVELHPVQKSTTAPFTPWTHSVQIPGKASPAMLSDLLAMVTTSHAEAWTVSTTAWGFRVILFFQALPVFSTHKSPKLQETHNY